jgi:hypothetical protein
MDKGSRMEGVDRSITSPIRNEEGKREKKKIIQNLFYFSTPAHLYSTLFSISFKDHASRPLHPARRSRRTKSLGSINLIISVTLSTFYFLIV